MKKSLKLTALIMIACLPLRAQMEVGLPNNGPSNPEPGFVYPDRSYLRDNGLGLNPELNMPVDSVVEAEIPVLAFDFDIDAGFSALDAIAGGDITHQAVEIATAFLTAVGDNPGGFAGIIDDDKYKDFLSTLENVSGIDEIDEVDFELNMELRKLQKYINDLLSQLPETRQELAESTGRADTGAETGAELQKYLDLYVAAGTDLEKIDYLQHIENHLHKNIDPRVNAAAIRTLLAPLTLSEQYELVAKGLTVINCANADLSPDDTACALACIKEIYQNRGTGNALGSKNTGVVTELAAVEVLVNEVGLAAKYQDRIENLKIVWASVSGETQTNVLRELAVKDAGRMAEGETPAIVQDTYNVLKNTVLQQDLTTYLSEVATTTSVFNPKLAKEVLIVAGLGAENQDQATALAVLVARYDSNIVGVAGAVTVVSQPGNANNIGGNAGFDNTANNGYVSGDDLDTTRSSTGTSGVRLGAIFPNLGYVGIGAAGNVQRAGEIDGVSYPVPAGDVAIGGAISAVGATGLAGYVGKVNPDRVEAVAADLMLELAGGNKHIDDAQTAQMALNAMAGFDIGKISYALFGRLDFGGIYSSLRLQNSISNFIGWFMGEIRESTKLVNSELDVEDKHNFNAPNVVIKDILEKLNPKKTEESAKLKIAMPQKIKLSHFAVLFLSLVIFSSCLGYSAGMYHIKSKQ